MNALILALTLLGADSNLPRDLNQSQINELRQIHLKMQSLKELHSANVMPQEVFDKSWDFYSKQAYRITGKSASDQDIVQIIAASENRASWIGNLFTLRNIIIFLSSLAAVVATTWLVGIYFFAIMIMIPKIVYEFVCYGVAFWFLTMNSMPFYLMGAFLMVPAAGLTLDLHLKGSSTVVRRRRDGSEVRLYYANILALMLALVWAVFAIKHQSDLLGFLSVMAFEAFLGFMLAVIPMGYAIGFEDEDHVLVGTSVSFLMMSLYVATFMVGADWGQFAVFRTGMLWMGCFVFYLGLLIMSSIWYGYRKRSTLSYLTMNVLTFIAGLGAFYFGSTYGITPLLGIGGTFFGLFVLEKYADLPWKEVGLAWSLAGLAAMGFAASHLIAKYPQYFVFQVVG